MIMCCLNVAKGMNLKMQEKIKKFLKKYLIGFMLGLISGSIAMVYAQTYFPSNQTTYDNSASGLSSTDVQEAIDELYNTCFPPTAGASILDNVDIVTSGDGLYADEYEEGRYFYKGKNVKNYVTFNNEAAEWRIISIEKDGTIKIMRNTSIGNQVWDSSNSNNWARPADLNTYLNSTYYNGLNSTAQSQIVSKDFSIGAVQWNDTSLSDSINDENSKKWNGKVALATASEYIRSNSNQGSCRNMNQIWNSTSCGNTTWMHNSTTWWTLSPASGSSYRMFRVYLDSDFSYNDANYSSGVRQVVYISSDVQITGGDGSQSNPFQFSL